MDSLGKFLKDIISKHYCSRRNLGNLGVNIFLNSIESGNVSGIPKEQLILIIKAICIAKKDRHTALSLLNQEIPKIRKRRFKFDSKNKRKRKFMRRRNG